MGVKFDVSVVKYTKIRPTKSFASDVTFLYFTPMADGGHRTSTFSAENDVNK